MKGNKWIKESTILGRRFHIDVWDSETSPKGIVIWFGGSGMTKEKYIDREKRVNTIFGGAWERLGKNLPIIFVVVNAPYDLEFANFSNSPADSERWYQHVYKEIIAKWSDLPIYLIGNSGGAALAFNGVHKNYRIVGAGGLGADQIPNDFEIPLDKTGRKKWKLNLFYNKNDILVYKKNIMIIEKLLRKDYATIGRHPGQHETFYYMRNGCFDALIKEALGYF